MFYCDECATEKGWNMTMFKSVGPCEVCGKMKECSDLPCKDLTKEPVSSGLKSVVVGEVNKGIDKANKTKLPLNYKIFPVIESSIKITPLYLLTN